jgi:hypothetical protein
MITDQFNYHQRISVHNRGANTTIAVQNCPQRGGLEVVQMDQTKRWAPTVRMAVTHRAGYSVSVGLASLYFSRIGLCMYRGCEKSTQTEYTATEKKWMKSRIGSGASLGVVREEDPEDAGGLGIGEKNSPGE